MNNAEETWKDKADEEILEAATYLDDYTDEARQIIVAEAERRGLDIGSLVWTTDSALRMPKRTGLITGCAFCDKLILFGGEREGASWFCGAECRHKARLLAVSCQIPDSTVTDRLWSLYQGNCPKCGGPGPVDVFTSHRVLSVFVKTFWGSRLNVCCARCGKRARIKDSFFSLMLGWWALPWGPIMTVVQLLRNMSLLFHRRADSKPTTQLERFVRLRLIAEEPPLCGLFGARVTKDSVPRPLKR